MTAAEIFAIPGAKRFWPTIERVEDYIKIKKEQKAKNGGKDIKDVWAKRQSGSGSFSLNMFAYLLDSPSSCTPSQEDLLILQ